MTHSLLLHYLVIWRPLGYFLVFLGVIIEGDVVVFTGAFLADQGFFDVFDLFFVILGGVLLGDLWWYWLGTKLEKLPASIKRLVEKVAKPFDYHIMKRPFHTILLSKFIYGIHHAILMRTGALKLGLKRYIRIDFVSTLLWMAAIGGLGYFSSASFVLIKHYIRFAEIGLLISLATFITISHYIARRSKRNL